MFKYQILIEPLGMMYGSAGAFLSPENLVGRSGAKFPPEAAALAGLFFSINYYQSKESKDELSKNLYVAGPFWAERKQKIPEVFVPIPWNIVITGKGLDRWRIEYQNEKPQWKRDKQDLEPEYTWQPIKLWNNYQDIKQICKEAKNSPWKYNPILHPCMRDEQRTVKAKDGLFFENAVQVDPDICLVYLSTHEIEPGWYRFGGENHIVEIDCIELKGCFLNWLQKPIKQAFALITPGVWGSQRFSYRYPQNWEFGEPSLMLTDKPIPYRYRTSGKLGRGRYAVPSGSVYVLDRPIDKPWWDWCKENKEWFPQHGFLKHVGGGLCLPVEIPGLREQKGAA